MKEGKGSNFTGAGFAIIDPASGKLLALIKNNGKFDIPKGHKDPGETPFQTACRECYEESSLLVSKDHLLTKKVYVSSGLHVFAAGVCSKKTKPKIKPNPETGEFEHLSYMWVTPEEFSKNSPKYLSKVIYAVFNDII